EVDAWEEGYKVVNEDIAECVIDAIEDQEDPVVMLHDYHLYTCPGVIRRARPDAFLHHFVHIPWSQPDSWRILPNRSRAEIYPSMLANAIIGFPTTPFCPNFLQCCRDLIHLATSYLPIAL